MPTTQKASIFVATQTLYDYSMTKTSIEYAHIYTNQDITEEHKLSVEVLKQVAGLHQDTTLVVMVDDYSFPDPSFDYDAFTQWLGQQGYGPDLLIRESQLIPVCDEVLKIIENPKLKNQITGYILSLIHI